MPGRSAARKILSAGVLAPREGRAEHTLFAELSDGQYLVWPGLERGVADGLRVVMRTRAYDERSVPTVSVVDRAGAQVKCREVDGDELVAMAAR